MSSVFFFFYFTNYQPQRSSVLRIDDEFVVPRFYGWFVGWHRHFYQFAIFFFFFWKFNCTSISTTTSIQIWKSKHFWWFSLLNYHKRFVMIDIPIHWDQWPACALINEEKIKIDNWIRKKKQKQSDIWSSLACHMCMYVVLNNNSNKIKNVPKVPKVVIFSTNKPIREIRIPLNIVFFVPNEQRDKCKTISFIVSWRF